MLRKSHSTRRRVVYIFTKRENMLLKYLTFMLRSLDEMYSDSLYYLMELDEYLEKHAVLYTRYADDIALFVESRSASSWLSTNRARVLHC
jgi:hypothetical protein